MIRLLSYLNSSKKIFWLAFFIGQFLFSQNTESTTNIAKKFTELEKTASADPNRVLAELYKLKTETLKTNNIEYYLKVLNKIDYVYYIKTDYHQVIKSTNNTIKEAQKYNDALSEAGARYTQAFAYSQLGFYEEANNTVNIGLNLIKNNEDDESLKCKGYLYTVKGEIFNKKSDDQNKALLYLKKSGEEFSKIKNISLKNKSLINAYSNYAVAYAALKKTDSAIYYNQLALQLNPKKYALDNTLAFIYMGLGLTYKEKKDTDKAISFFIKSAKLSDSIKAVDISLISYKNIRDLYDQKKDQKKFIHFAKKYSTLKDSINDATRTKMDDTLKEIVEKKQENNKKFYLKIILFLIAITIFLFVIWFYGYNRLKRIKTQNNITSNLLEKEKQEKSILESKINDFFDELIHLAKENSPNFYVRFSEIYPEIHLKLTKEYPQLSTFEKSFLAMVFLNFSNKEIANIESVSLKTIEIRKYRIRKKCDLESGQDLKKWLDDLAITENK